MKRWILTIIMASLCSGSLATEACNWPSWTSFGPTELVRRADSAAYRFITDHMRIDADGAPNAYHPADRGLDFLANAGYPDKAWWRDVLVADPANPSRAHVQPDGPFAGYFVSMTALEDRRKFATDPDRYVDATRVPYLVFPGAFYRMAGTGRLGDLGLAIHTETGKRSGFVVADIGPGRALLGEVSIRLAENLGGHGVNPRNGSGAPEGKVLYLVFPYSSRVHPWPMSEEEIVRAVDALLQGVDSECVSINPGG